MGVKVEEFEDGLFVNGPTRLRGARLDAFGDHRAWHFQLRPWSPMVSLKLRGHRV